MKYLSFLCVLVCSHFAFAQQTLQLADLNKIVSLSSPAISPDGNSAVYIATYRNYEENRFDSKLYWNNIINGEQKVLSSRKGLGSPGFTPDGRYISFLASGENGRQLFLLPVDGGEALPLTEHPTGLRRYAWSPSGKLLAYISSAPRPKKTGTDRFNNAFVVGSDDYLQTQAPTNSTVWVFNMDSKASKKISPEDFTVATELSMSSLAWSPDETQLLVTRYPSSHSGDSDLGNNYILFLNGDEPKKVFSENGYQGGAFFSPDGKILFSYRRDGVPSNVNDLYELDQETSKVQNRSMGIDRNISGAQYSPYGELLLRAPDVDRQSYWKETVTGGFQKINFGELTSVGGLSFSKKGSMVFTGQTPYHPNEIYFKAGLNAPPKALTHFNEAIAEKNQGKREAISWTSTDDFSPNGIVTYPIDFDPQKKYPLVLYIHGGPTASSLLSFSTIPQIMAAQGWIVFQPNYRGSNNLGNAFQSAIANDAAEGPGEDVMSGVEFLIKKGFVDTQKIVVSGWSYGGWMTSWMIGRYPEVWAAAVAGAAPVDYTDMYSLSDLNRMRRHAITGSPYTGDNLMKAYEQSPIIHFSKLKTPTLIMSKTGDYRVSITGSYKLYGALRDNNVPVEFVAYPGPGHFPSDPVRSMDVYSRWISWFQKYIGKKRP